MSQTYYAILTNAGKAKLANAIALGVPLKLTHMGVGDGNGKEVTPDPTMTSLPGEQRRAAINTLFADPLNAAQLVAEQVIPADEGGWWVRCAGLYDEAGTLVAIANTPASFKPLLTTGAGRTQVIRMVLIVSNTAAVELKIDPAVVLATRKYCDEKIEDLLSKHERSRSHPDATQTEKGLIRLATDEEARLGQAVDAVMSSKNVADAVKDMLKQMFVGVPIPWFAAEPPSWALAMQGQAINPTTDPLLAQRYPGLILDDMRDLVVRGLGSGAIRAKLKGTLVAVEMANGSGIDAVWCAGVTGGKTEQGARDAIGVDNYSVSDYQGVGMGYANLTTSAGATAQLPGPGYSMATSGVVRVPSRLFNYITMRG